MTFQEKLKFSSEVFEEVLKSVQIISKSAGGLDPMCKTIAILAKAQIKALPPAKKALEIDSRGQINFAATCSKINASYDIALELAPLVGIEERK